MPFFGISFGFVIVRFSFIVRFSILNCRRVILGSRVWRQCRGWAGGRVWMLSAGRGLLLGSIFGGSS